MPELPEVKTITTDLKNEIVGKKVKGVKVAEGYPLKPSAELFMEKLVSYQITSVNNTGKLIHAGISSGYHLAVHLNMTGNLLYNVSDPYVKVSVFFEDGNILNFSDVRKFGYFQIWDSSKLKEFSSRTGWDLLGSELTEEKFREVLKSSNTTIKNLLLNQRKLSGLGNIYANDALFMTGIHPRKKSSDLTDKEISELLKNIKQILTEGILHRGSSIDRYKDLYGKPGKHQEHFRVYGKKDQTCPKCRKGTIQYEKIQGRGTFICNNCQKV